MLRQQRMQRFPREEAPSTLHQQPCELLKASLECLAKALLTATSTMCTVILPLRVFSSLGWSIYSPLQCCGGVDAEVCRGEARIVKGAYNMWCASCLCP